MSASATNLLNTLSNDGRCAHRVAAAICSLVEGAELGALDEVEMVAADGTARRCKRIPPLWLDRLETAVAVGAFDRLTVKQIVERIIAPPLPAEAEM